MEREGEKLTYKRCQWHKRTWRVRLRPCFWSLFQMLEIPLLLQPWSEDAVYLFLRDVRFQESFPFYLLLFLGLRFRNYLCDVIICIVV